jgi:hypothetical protein
MITVNKKINLTQLDKELNSLGLNAQINDNYEIVAIGLADNNNATEAELEAAIEAHIAGPTEEEVKLLNRQQGMDKLKELGFTDEQILALIGGN